MLLRDEFDPAPVSQVRIDADPSASLEWKYTVNEFGSNFERHRRELLVHCSGVGLAAAKALVEGGLVLLLLVGVKQNSIEPNNRSARMRPPFSALPISAIEARRQK